MKSLAAALSVLLLTGVVYGRNPAPAPVGITGHDTTLASARKAGPASMRERSGKRLFPGHGMNFTQDNMAPADRQKNRRWYGKEQRRIRGLCEQHCCPPFSPFCVIPLFCGILFFGILLWGIVNILLTVIVSLDMKQNGRFNGLWIPILLIAGIPGTIIYALFRIGDRVAGRQG